ncbi:MAG: nuclear transport factor 2 family protein [Prochlorothrix sp.]
MSNIPPAHTVIRDFYQAINDRDLTTAFSLVDDNCLYQDLNFSQPFQGKNAVCDLLKDSCTGIPADLRFVIDDITIGDPSAVGILWHVELGGIPIPNGRGASFCRVSERSGKLVFARDLVEPPMKPGAKAFLLLRLLLPLLRRVPRRFQRQRPGPQPALSQVIAAALASAEVLPPRSIESEVTSPLESSAMEAVTSDLPQGSSISELSQTSDPSDPVAALETSETAQSTDDSWTDRSIDTPSGTVFATLADPSPDTSDPPGFSSTPSETDTLHSPFFPPRTLISWFLWFVAASYIYLILLSPAGQPLPGDPVWAVQLSTLREVVKESTNFFFILPLLNALGWHGMETPLVHPVNQALFNLVEAWIFMLLPLFLLDRRSQGLPRVLLVSGALFLTNALLLPVLALRSNRSTPSVLSPASEMANPVANVAANSVMHPVRKGILSRVFGAIGLTVGTVSLGWFCLAHPEMGDFLERLRYFGFQFTHDRVFLAFSVDAVLLSLLQVFLLGEVGAKTPQSRLRFIPFGGLALWLLV